MTVNFIALMMFAVRFWELLCSIGHVVSLQDSSITVVSLVLDKRVFPLKW